MFDLPGVQQALRQEQLDGWLLYDFRGSNELARRVLGLGEGPLQTRRWCYCIPASGQPLKLTHRIEQDALAGLPGNQHVYLRWQEFEQGVARLVAGMQTVAMEYSPRNANPYVAKVDAGLVELVREQDVVVRSSGDLIQQFEATWDDAQWRLHQQASEGTASAFDAAWRLIAERVRADGGVEETAVRDAILAHFQRQGLVTEHGPIVARAEHSASPHYETGGGQDTRIREGDVVLIDLWAKRDAPRAVYSDLTRMGFVGTAVPEAPARVFAIVAAARDAAIARVRQAMAGGQELRGWEVDEAARSVIRQAGYGDRFTHRTGHNIGQEVHGNGAHMDNLETREERRVLPRTCFSIEPGIYLEQFGVRSEVDVYVDQRRQVHVTGGQLQQEITPILAAY